MRKRWAVLAALILLLALPLSTSGWFLIVNNPQHADVQKAMHEAVKRLRALGKPAGILTGNEEEARRYIDWGYLFVAVGADVGLLARNADALAKKFKG